MRYWLFLSCFFSAIVLSAQTPPWQWVDIAGGGGTSTLFDEQSTDMVVDQDGNTYVAGAITYFAHFDTTYIQGYGGSDIFLAKYSCEGDLQWVQTAGSNSGNEDLAFVALDDSGGVYWAGEMESTGSNNFHIGDSVFTGELNTFFISKVNPVNGDFFWIKPQGVGNVWIQLFGFNAGSGYLFVNARHPLLGGLVAGVNLKGQYLARFDLDGNFVDVNNYAANSPRITGNRIAIDEIGNVFIVGHFSQFVVIGNDTLRSAAGIATNGLLLKFDPNINFQWHKILASPYTVALRDISIDGNNNLVLTGIFSDSLYYGNGVLLRTVSGSNSIPYTLKLDNDGSGVWARTINYYGGSSCQSYDVTHDADDNIYISGHYYNSIAFGPDTLRAYSSMEPFYLSYDSAGNYRFAGSVSCLGNSGNVGLNISVDGNQNVFLAGTFGSGIVFQNDTIDRAYGDTDLFIAKFGQASCVPPCPVPVAGFSFSANNLSVTFTDASTDADSLRYTAGGNAVTGSSHLFPTPGNYTVCQYAYSNCGTDTLCQQVTVFCAPPTAGFGTDVSGLSVSLLDSSSLADSVRYTVGGNAITGSFHTFDIEGTYTVCQYVANVCGTGSLCKQITVNDVGVTETALLHKLYPNPTNGQVTIELPAGNYKLELFDLLGERVRDIAFQDKTTLSISQLPQGVYMYRITAASGKSVMGRLVLTY